MARFVLVHGAWHGAWCWREIVPRLKAKGHETTAIDLPAHGEGSASPESVTLQDYVDRIVEAVDAAGGTPILASHSGMGGVIGQAAEVIPDRVRGLVYIAALVPPDGTSLMQHMDGLDPESLAQFEWSPDRRTARISPKGAREFLYPRCPPAAVESILPLLTPEPAAPYETPMQVTEANFGRVPKYYIECLQDRTVPIAFQRAMRHTARFDGVYSLDTDHSPFFSAPDDLAAILCEIAAEP